MTTENEIATGIVDACYRIHTAMGPGLLESVYETVLAHDLQQRGLQVSRQTSVPFIYQGHQFDEGFRADLVVEEKVIVELKSLEKIAPVHKKQLLTYLKLSNMKLGLLVNFGENFIKDGIFRIANGL